MRRRAARAQVVNSISNDSDMPDVRDSESAAQVMVSAARSVNECGCGSSRDEGLRPRSGASFASVGELV